MSADMPGIMPKAETLAGQKLGLEHFGDRSDQYFYVWNDAHCAFLDPFIYALCSELRKSNF